MNLKPYCPCHRLASRTLILALALSCAAAGAQPQPGRSPEREADGRRDSDSRRGGDGRRDSDSRSSDNRSSEIRSNESRSSESRSNHDQRRDSSPRVEAGRWYDGAHGNNHYYPRPGWAVSGPPARSRVVVWGGVNYRYHDSVWYAPGTRGYVVVRPPYGAVIVDRPAFFSLLTIGAVAYLYTNGVYYRERSDGYEVVPPPVEGASTVTQTKTYAYPRQAQSAQQQAADEYECHRWAVSQTGFDPSGAATGQSTAASPAQRDNYQRATNACLDGRGYTVR